MSKLNLQTLAAEIEKLKRELHSTKEDLGRAKALLGGLKYPLDDNSQKILKEIIKDSIKAEVWDSFWRSSTTYQTFFESEDGFIKYGNVLMDEGGVSLITADSTDAIATVRISEAVFPDKLSFSKPTRMRTRLTISDDTDREGFICVGGDAGLAGDIHSFGFRINNNNLEGFCQKSDAKRTTLTLIPNFGPGSSLLDCTFFPNSEIYFSVDNELKGIIRENLPTTMNDTYNIWIARIKTTEDVAKGIFLSFIEVSQRLT